MATQTPSRNKTETKPEIETPAVAPRRGGVRFLAIATALAIFVALLPTLASRTPLGNLLLNYAVRLGKLHGSASAGSLSIGWFSPVSATDLEIRDPQGKTLLTVPLVEMDKTLWQLLRDHSQLGGIKLDRPTLEISLRDDGSNLEEVLAAWLPFDLKRDIERIDCALEIVAGQAIIHDESAKRDWKIEQCKLALQSPGATSEPVKLVVSGVMPEIQPEGHLALTLRLGGGQPAEIKFGAKALPLEAAQALLRRAAPGSQWSGRLEADLHYHGDGADRQLLEGDAVVSQFALSAPWLGGDQLALAQLELPCRLDWKGDHLTIEELGVACDVGELECYATLADSSSLLQVRGLKQFIALASRGDGETTGRLDLAKLAKLLPGTLRIREGAEITASDVQWKIASRLQAADASWQGSVTTTKLVAQYRGKELTWDQPLAVQFNAHPTEQGPAFDKIACQSDFLQLEGAGTADAFHLSGTHDLAKLTAQLSRFVDLGGLHLAGAGTTTLDYRRLEGNRFQAAAEMQVDGWALARPGETPWTEPQIIATAHLEGEWEGMTPISVDSARCEATAGQDRLDVTLAKPVQIAAAETTWPIDWKLSGELATWLERVRRQAPQADSWQFSGACQGRGQLQYSAARIAGDGELIVDNFAVGEPSGGAWNEPQVKFVAQAGYDRKHDALQLDRVQFASAAMALDARGKIEKLASERDAQIDGDVTYDWARLQGMLQAYAGDSVKLAGRETRPFSLSGPLASLGEGRQTAVTRLAGQAELGWQSADVLGTPLGPGQVRAELARGALRFSPLDLPLSGGKVRLAPTIELAQTPAELSLEPGRIVDQVEITPEMCNAGMKYALPVLAEVAEAEGRFSVTLDGCQLPLTNLGAGDAAGKILIHSVQVGPGALTREFAPIIELLAETLGAKGSVRPLGPVAITRESHVDYRMVQGRVYHRGLELAFPDVLVRTYGSVGLDQSLAIMAEMPVPSKWIGDNALGQSLQGQTIRLPINGTLHKPKIDAREIQRLAGRVVEDTAKSMLHHEIGRQLDRLFGPVE